MVDILINIGYGVIGSVIASFIYAIFNDYIDYWLVYRKSDFTGYWKNSVLDSHKNVIKIDYCHLLHNRRTGTIKGTIVREFPETQNDRKWFCNGVIVNDRIIMSFWSAYEHQKSDGSGYLFLTGDKKFEGVYMHSTNENKIASVDVMSEMITDVDKINRAKKLFKK